MNVLFLYFHHSSPTIVEYGKGTWIRPQIHLSIMFWAEYPPHLQFVRIQSLLFHCKIHEAIKGFFLVPVVEPETELVHVPLHVLDRDVVEYAVHSALQYRPKTFDTVCMYAVSERVCYCVVYLEPDEVALVLPVEDVVSGELVGHHRRVRLAYLFEYGEKLLSAQPLALVVVVCDNGVYLSRIAFLYAYYGRLGRSTTSFRTVLVILVAIIMLVFLAWLSADIGLVYLHDLPQRSPCIPRSP